MPTSISNPSYNTLTTLDFFNTFKPQFLTAIYFRTTANEKILSELKAWSYLQYDYDTSYEKAMTKN